MKLTSQQIDKLAITLSTAMFSLIWESDYSPQSAPDEDAIYDTIHATLKRIAKDRT